MKNFKKDEILVREIIDIDTNYLDYDSSDESDTATSKN